MRYLLIILLFSSCMTTYKAYQKVAADPFVDAKESVLLSQKCLTVYPDIRDTVRVISEGIDSASYNATIEAYNELLDSIISQYDRADEIGLFDTATTVAPISAKDSLKVIRNFLRRYKPPAITKTITKEVPVRDGKWEEQRRLEIQACRAENAQAVADKEKAEKKLQHKSAAMGWIIGGGLLLAILSFITGRIIRR